ncbi:hypothetical protein TVAG_546980, partial [Trichomonas vaginalis G3]
MSDVPPTEPIPKPEEPKAAEPQQSPQQPQFQQVPPPNYYQFPPQGYYQFPLQASRTTLLLSLCLTSPTLGCSSKLHPSIPIPISIEE